MSERKFTPGPWRVSKNKTLVIAGFNNRVLGFVHGKKEENAILAASAPELYDALEELIRAYTGPSMKLDLALVSRSCAALAKARGEENA